MLTNGREAASWPEFGRQRWLVGIHVAELLRWREVMEMGGNDAAWFGDARGGGRFVKKPPSAANRCADVRRVAQLGELGGRLVGVRALVLAVAGGAKECEERRRCLSSWWGEEGEMAAAMDDA